MQQPLIFPSNHRTFFFLTNFLTKLPHRVEGLPQKIKKKSLLTPIPACPDRDLNAQSRAVTDMPVSGGTRASRKRTLRGYAGQNASHEAR